MCPSQVFGVCQRRQIPGKPCAARMPCRRGSDVRHHFQLLLPEVEQQLSPVWCEDKTLLLVVKHSFNLVRKIFSVYGQQTKSLIST